MKMYGQILSRIRQYERLHFYTESYDCKQYALAANRTESMIGIRQH